MGKSFKKLLGKDGQNLVNIVVKNVTQKELTEHEKSTLRDFRDSVNGSDKQKEQQLQEVNGKLALANIEREKAESGRVESENKNKELDAEIAKLKVQLEQEKAKKETAEKQAEIAELKLQLMNTKVEETQEGGSQDIVNNNEHLEVAELGDCSSHSDNS